VERVERMEGRPHDEIYTTGCSSKAKPQEDDMHCAHTHIQTHVHTLLRTHAHTHTHTHTRSFASSYILLRPGQSKGEMMTAGLRCLG
jgi:hypothetical protein